MRAGAEANFVRDGGQQGLGEARPVGEQHERKGLHFRAKRANQTPHFRIALGQLHVDPLIGDLVAGEKIAQFVRAIGPARAEYADTLIRLTIGRDPFLKQVVQGGIQLFFRGVPGLHEVVVDAGFVDGVDGRAGVRIGGKQGALGERMKFHGFGEKADAVHLRHALVGKKEGDRIVAGF